MSTIELKSKIWDLLSHSENEAFLMRVYQNLLDNAATHDGQDWWESLTPEQQSHVEASRKSIAEGRVYSNQSVYEESLKWLGK